ncbi:reverse transcriptase Ty1/copia-type domain-containing protein [Citrus sinensis]|uniref:Reverse transcriptase Ty1/copia-type domain-containing protein n=1 Tax=Citrus sinensis TaxID=2711 RepID=A0ACB8IPK8_CITSI|nr:reverse transcriptase Ty1/copia-type domain-containing protein [Citrus sinensis]
MAKRYILASISVELHKKHRNMETTTEIMASLHKMFRQNTNFAREAALKRITDTKMEEGTKVRDHVLKMMDYLNEVEIHGVQINDKSKINIVIESLPDTFKEFKVNYILNNKDRTLIELMHELHAIEEFYHSRKLPEKGFSSRLKSKDKNEQARVRIDKLSTKRSGKPKGKCYKCGQKGHWKKDCPKIIKIRVWELVEAPNEVKPIGCKWIYKRKRGVDGRVETFKARLVAEGFTQKEGIDYEETFSPVTMLKSIRIPLSIAAVLDYEIWQMNVKIAFLNVHLEENIYMQQPDGFIQKGQEHMVCKLQRSIYGLKQASRSWNIRFDQVIKSLGFIQNIDEPCAYKKTQKKFVAFLVLCVDNILLIGNDIGVLTTIKIWLAKQFDMKDLGQTSYILVEHIIKYLKKTKNYMLVYSGNELIPVGYTDSDFMSDKDSRKSTSGYVFTLGSGAISWRSVKQSCIADSTTKAEYVAASEAAKEVVWLRKFLQDLEVVPVVTAPLKLFCDNSGGVAQSKEPQETKPY